MLERLGDLPPDAGHQCVEVGDAYQSSFGHLSVFVMDSLYRSLGVVEFLIELLPLPGEYYLFPSVFLYANKLNYYHCQCGLYRL